ncbi:MAG TPA: hypothetical protein VGI24_12280 [Solirubrobacteraceae bacterium]
MSGPGNVLGDLAAIEPAHMGARPGEAHDAADGTDSAGERGRAGDPTQPVPLYRPDWDGQIILVGTQGVEAGEVFLLSIHAERRG